MQGTTSPEQEPFWLFYSNERVFPLGWAEQKGIKIIINIILFYFYMRYIIYMLNRSSMESNEFRCNFFKCY